MGAACCWDGAGGTARLAAWLDAERPDVVVVAEANRRIRDDLAQHGWWSVTGRSGPRARVLPFGRPISWTISATSASDIGTCSDGLTM